VDKFSKLTLTEKRDAISRAFDGLDEGDRERIQRMAEELVKYVKTRNPLFVFPFDGALEVISRVGMVLSEAKAQGIPLPSSKKWQEI
jgi:adenine-specific DNA methylase